MFLLKMEPNGTLKLMMFVLIKENILHHQIHIRIQYNIGGVIVKELHIIMAAKIDYSVYYAELL